jgi:hypothetical protein
MVSQSVRLFGCGYVFWQLDACLGDVGQRLLLLLLQKSSRLFALGQRQLREEGITTPAGQVVASSRFDLCFNT